MKIMNIILDGRIAGPQIRIAEISKILKDNFNIDTVVVFPEKNSESFKNILDEYGIRWHREKLHRLSKNIFNLIAYFFLFPKEIWKLKGIVKKENADIVHCNGSWQWKGVIAGKWAKKKVVWHLNDTKIPFFIKFIFKLLSKKVDGFIVTGEKVKEYYLTGFNIKKSMANIEAPVNMEKYDPDRVESDHGFNRYKGIKIVSVCNVNPYKGIEYMIEAAEILNKKFKNTNFIVVGNLFDTQKKYINFLKKKIKDNNIENFYFHGPSGNIPSILNSSDIFICSSIAEAGPMSVLEAMAMEKPVVSTDVGSVSDFIKNGENGFIVNIKDSKAMAEKIGILLENREMSRIFGKSARSVVKKKLDERIIAKKYNDIYSKIKNEK